MSAWRFTNPVNLSPNKNNWFPKHDFLCNPFLTLDLWQIDQVGGLRVQIRGRGVRLFSAGLQPFLLKEQFVL